MDSMTEYDRATPIPAQGQGRVMPSSRAAVTIERIERAITLTAYIMQRHNLPQLLPTLKRLEAARDDLQVNGDALEYAKRILDRGTIAAQRRSNLPHYNIDPNHASAHGAS
jgi:hypothetical protein